MTEKLAVAIWNYKGGVGKSIIALILAEIAAQNGLKVLAIDLDEQKNFSATFKLTGTLFPTIEIRDTITSECANEDYNLYVLDTHPSKDETVKSALQFADIVLVPVLGDFNSIMNLRSVFGFITSCGVGEGQIAIVKNAMNKYRISADVEETLSAQGWPVAGRLPQSNILTRNIASGLSWDKFMRPDMREPYIELYTNIWRAYRYMVAGKFINLWEWRPCRD